MGLRERVGNWILGGGGGVAETVIRIEPAVAADAKARSDEGNGGRRARGAVGRPAGWAGPKRYSALGLDDFNPDVSGAAALRVADKMRRTDGQVRAIQSVIGLPIRSTHWYVEPPKGASPTEREAAELLDADLMGGMLSSFDDVLRELLRSVYLGVAVPEIEWEEREGRMAVRNVWPRNPELIESWLYDEGGRVVGYVYSGSRVSGVGCRVDGQTTTRYERVAVPLYRCIHAAYEAENGSPWGMGLWRAMYPHWSFKHSAYLLLGIGLERNLLGAPYATASEGALPTDRDEVRDLLRLFRTTEDAGIAMPYGWELGWLESKGSPSDAMPLVNHHDALMARAALAQFLNLGQTGTGTQALAAEHVKLFLDAEDGVARWLGEVLTRSLVREWWRLNYGGRGKSGEERGKSAAGLGPGANCRLESGDFRFENGKAAGIRCPRLRHRPIRERNLEGMARALSLLGTGGFLTATAADEEHVRQVAELPEVPREQLAVREKLTTETRRHGEGAETRE